MPLLGFGNPQPLNSLFAKVVISKEKCHEKKQCLDIVRDGRFGSRDHQGARLR